MFLKYLLRYNSALKMFPTEWLTFIIFMIPQGVTLNPCKFNTISNIINIVLRKASGCIEFRSIDLIIKVSR